MPLASNFTNPIIVITGGTGSFGQAFTRFLLSETEARVRVFSRDEHKQESMADELPPGPRLTYILGDVRGGARLRRALDGADIVVHAAALKTVPAGERHASEFIETNITGTRNVIRASLAAGIKRVLFISSDKAVAPINTYGKTKAVAESLITQANQYGVTTGTRFASVRGGNVFGSRGSVVERWNKQVEAGRALTLTNGMATRFHMTLPIWTAYCWRVVKAFTGGEIFVPKLKAWKLDHLAFAFSSPGGVYISGNRAGDKQHEILISGDESAVDAGWTYIIEPPAELRAVWIYPVWAGERLPAGASITSEQAELLTVPELREAIRQWKS